MICFATFRIIFCVFYFNASKAKTYFIKKNPFSSVIQPLHSSSPIKNRYKIKTAFGQLTGMDYFCEKRIRR